MPHLILSVLFRWLHIASACCLIGGFFFMRVVLPGALMRLEEPQRTETLVRVRRRFKFVIHTSILFLIISGIYNSMGNWPAYGRFRPLSDALWGGHVALAALVFTLALVLLARPMPPRGYKAWAVINLLLMAITLAVAGTLKYERQAHPATPPTIVVMATKH